VALGLSGQEIEDKKLKIQS